MLSSELGFFLLEVYSSGGSEALVSLLGRAIGWLPC